MKKLSLFAVTVLLLPVTALGASDYLLKLGGVEGETKPTQATMEPIPATLVQPATTVAPPPTGGTEASGGYIKIEDIKGESSEAEKKKGNVDYGWKVEEGENAMDDKGHKNEIDILSADGMSESASNFGILLGGSDTSDERKRGLERAAEVIREHAKASGQAMESLSLNFTKIEYKLKTDAKLFGFIPMQVLATVDIDETETATVKLPWWAIFATGVEREEIGMKAKETLSNILKTQHDAVKNAIANVR